MHIWTNNNQEELIASVSEFEARERVRSFYEQIGNDFIKGREYYVFPYSFVSGTDSLLFFKGELRDINDNKIECTEPQI